MGRTRLRGIELAGMRLAVESPPGFEWDWPERGLRQLARAPVDPDVYVGVSIGAAIPPKFDPITYAYDGGTFDVGRVGDEWWVAVHRSGHRYERVARFDRSFGEGEVVIAPSAIERLRHPLDGPLLDLLLIHRIILGGGLVLSGTAVIERGRALAMLSSGDDSNGNRWPAWVTRDAPDVVQTPGSRFGLCVRDGVPRVYGLPGAHGHPEAGLTARLEAIHLMTRSDRVFADPLDTDRAVHELVQHACAPVHAADVAEQLLGAAAHIGATVPMLRLGVPSEEAVVPFDWSRRQASLGFAGPSAR